MMLEAGERIQVKVEREDVDWSVDDPVGTSRGVEVKREPGVGRKKAGRKKLKLDLFKCDQPNCQFSTKYRPNLNRHASVHSDERSRKCDKCEKTFKTSDYLKRHLRVHSPFQCDECQKVFATRMSLKRHLKVHFEEILNQCYECYYSGPCKKPVEQNEAIRVKTNLIKCQDCDYSCKSKQNLIYHFRVRHSAMEPWRCDHPNCQYTTRVIGNMKRHKIMVHESKKPFKCEECQRAFQTKCHLKRHSFVHSRMKPFKCQKCQYSSNDKRQLEVHERRRHVHEKEHKCDECGISYRLKEELDKHKLNHNDAAKKFKCHLCPFSARRKWNLYRHSQSHLNKGRFKRDRSFNRAQHLKSHRFIHSKMENFSCDECDYRTNNPRNLRRHLLVCLHSVSKASSGENCDHCGLPMLDQSESTIHRDAHRPCSVPLPRVSDSGAVISAFKAPPLLRRVKIELNDDVIKKENV